jgi:hypothetical protein
MRHAALDEVQRRNFLKRRSGVLNHVMGYRLGSVRRLQPVRIGMRQRGQDGGDGGGINRIAAYQSPTVWGILVHSNYIATKRPLPSLVFTDSSKHGGIGSPISRVPAPHYCTQLHDMRNADSRQRTQLTTTASRGPPLSAGRIYAYLRPTLPAVRVSQAPKPVAAVRHTALLLLLALRASRSSYSRLPFSIAPAAT